MQHLNLRILDRKEKKEFLGLLKKQFGFSEKLDYVFLINNKNRLFIVNKEIADVNLEKLKINSIGLYIAEFKNNEVRLSIEGSQLIAPKSKSNVIELDEKEVKDWLGGKDLKTKIDEKTDGFVILKCGKDYFGSGKIKQGNILNFIPKARRLNNI